jgi:DNA-directed RNA polymerase specialized sigma24 family protein
VDRTKGKFRTFLLAALDHFLAKEWHRLHRLKRGGQASTLSLDAQEAEARYTLEPPDLLTPEKVFERRWALTVLDQAMSRLCKECETKGKSALFEELKAALSGDNESGYIEIGARLSMSEGAIKVAVHRLRQRYAELLRQEIANTVSHPDEVEGEIRNLCAALS